MMNAHLNAKNGGSLTLMMISITTGVQLAKALTVVVAVVCIILFNQYLDSKQERDDEAE